MQRRGVQSIGLCAALAIGCGDDADTLDLPDEVLWESAHFRYHTRARDDFACEGVLTELERHFDEMHEYLRGAAWPEERKVDYYKFVDRPDFEANSGCPANAGSCARGSSVLSPNALQPHELIHAYLSPLGIPPAFFVEGIAAALNCDHVWAVAPKPFDEVVDLPFGNDQVYLEGPWFTGHLLQEFGPERYLSLYERLTYTASLADISAAFESVYERPLEEVWNEAAQTNKRVRCVNRWACSTAPVPLDGSPFTLRRACDGTDSFRTFELDTERDLILDPAGHFLYPPLSCDEAFPHPIGGDSVGGTLMLTSVAPVTSGRYFMAPWEEFAEMRVRAPEPKAFSLDCSAAGSVDLARSEFETSHFELAIPSDGPPWFVKLRPANGRAVLVQDNGVVRVAQCSDCGDPPTCTTVDFATTPGADGNVLLRLTPSTPSPGYAVATLLHTAASSSD